MGHHNSDLTSVVDQVGHYKISSTLKGFFGVATLIGIASFAAGVSMNPGRAWPNFLLNYFFFLMLALSGAFFTALQHITNAYWSVTVRRLSESLMSYLPVALVLGFILLVGKHHLYEWAHTEVVAQDHLLKLKAAYLNPSFFTVRVLVFFAIWMGIGLSMRKNSLAQDKTGEEKFTLKNIKLAALFLPLFAISVTLASFDLIMSLEPHWFSTIFGVYCFAGLFFSGLCTLAILIVYGKKQGYFSDALVNENHLHDVGKLMFGFTVFWTYIGFSQLMLQWYANLPEEIPYYLRRFEGGWWNYGLVLLVLHFFIPFFGLLPREAKRCGSYLGKMAILMLFAQWLDVYFMVMPVFFKQGPVFGWMELGIALGFLGLFGISVGRFLESAPAIPKKDPRLAQCLGHHQ